MAPGLRHRLRRSRRASGRYRPRQLRPKMAAATAPGLKPPPGESGGPAASALSMERIQSLTDLADLEAAYSRLCEEEVCGAGHGRRRGP